MFVSLCFPGGPLAVTDANLVLGRLLPNYFPKIFGPNENEPLDLEAAKYAMNKLALEVSVHPLVYSRFYG